MYHIFIYVFIPVVTVEYLPKYFAIVLLHQASVKRLVLVLFVIIRGVVGCIFIHLFVYLQE